jgi:DNA invertase Pin-like site-specific DNA recombinase
MSPQPAVKSVAVYVRVSRLDQHPENQIAELRRYVEARGWTATEFVEHGVSGAKDRRPRLDAMMKDVRRRKFDAVVVWKMDRLGRSLHHLIGVMNELRDLGVAFVSLGEGIDTSTSVGRMVFGILGSIAEFERERLRERTMLGLDRAKAQGKRLGRPADAALRARIADCAGVSVREAARRVGCSTATIQKVRKLLAA